MISSVRFEEIYAANTYLYFASGVRVPSFARCRLTNDSRKIKRFSPFARLKLLNLVPKLNFTHNYISFYDYLWLYYHDYSWFMYNLISFGIVSCRWCNHTILLLKFVAEKCDYFWRSPWLLYLHLYHSCSLQWRWCLKSFRVESKNLHIIYTVRCR